VKIELLLGAGLADRASEHLPILEENALLDLTWLRRCPLLAPIRTDPRFVSLERSTAARAARVIEVLDEDVSGLRKSG